MRGKGKVPEKFFTQVARDRWTRTQLRQLELREVCEECGFKVRGPNHREGTHHKTKHPSQRKG